MVVQVDTNLIKDLKNKAKASQRKRYLHSLHPNYEAYLHTMINVFCKGTYVVPHRHYVKDENHQITKKGESFFVLEGKAKLITFTNKGEVLEVYQMHANQKPMLWLSEETWHTIVPTTDFFVVFENKTGPWKALTDKAFHSGFPKEGEAGVDTLIKEWEKL